MRHNKLKIAAIFFIFSVFFMSLLQVNGFTNVKYNVNIGSWVNYSTNEYFRSKIIINSSTPISHNGSASYYTKVTITGMNSSFIVPGVYNKSFGVINGTIASISMGQIFQTINQINVGPFLGFFYPITNITLINSTMNDFNGKTYHMSIFKNNLSKLPSEIRYFLNPSSNRKIINLSSDLRYQFYNISYDIITLQPLWYLNAVSFHELVLNFTLGLNISSYMNISYNGLTWLPTEVKSTIELNFLVFIDTISGVVLKMQEQGNIDYFESHSENVQPYFGQPYNLTLFLRKSYIFFSSNVINFGFSFWFWLIIILVISGVLFVLLYLVFTRPKKRKKKPSYFGNILE
ncbi:MAG: hypothetical protein ACTSWR_04790 [Candidatus Helarchaeota archaeon]